MTTECVDLLFMHPNTPVGGDQDISGIEGIIRPAACADIPVGFSRGAVDVLRGWHVQGLMRSFCVEFSDEGVESGMLLQHVYAGRACRFLLQGQVRSLAPAVLSRMAGLG